MITRPRLVDAKEAMKEALTMLPQDARPSSAIASWAWSPSLATLMLTVDPTGQRCSELVRGVGGKSP
jgi:hypothetical protein